MCTLIVREGLLVRHLVASALVLGLLMTYVSGSNAARGQAQLPSSRNASLFLRTDRAQYSLRDSIVIDVGVRNDGREPIYVYNIMAWGFGGGLVLWLRDHDDKVIEPVMRDDTMLPPPPAGDTSILSRLGPSMFIGDRRTLEVKLLVRQRGRYSIQVEYASPLVRQVVDPTLQALPALWSDTPHIWSEKVVLDIRD